MTNLVIQSQQMLLPIDLSSLTATAKMSDQQFYEFCRTNPELRIERNAAGEVIVMPPAFADAGMLCQQRRKHLLQRSCRILWWS